MSNKIDDGWTCGICLEVIKREQPAVRVAADCAISDGDGGYLSLTNREVLVLAIFHTGCVMDTMHEDYVDEVVDYLEEARDILREASLCDHCEAQVKGPQRPRFTLLPGGVR